MEVRAAIETRRAYRSLDPATITDELIKDLAASARLAPSCFNYQPWRFVFVRDPEVPGEMHGALAKHNMWSQRVAGVLFLGSWYHKAVIFTENAARVGALTLGGTDTTHNIPFLVAICDYSIIGEELYALGAYVSEDPTQTASLAGQDIGKYIALILILLGSILATVGFDISGIFAW